MFRRIRCLSALSAAESLSPYPAFHLARAFKADAVCCRMHFRAWLFWLLPVVMGLLVLTRLPADEPAALSEGMKTIAKAKKPAAKRPLAKPAGHRIAGLSPRRTPPPAVGTVADVLKMGDEFGKGANWDVIATAHESRDS